MTQSAVSLFAAVLVAWAAAAAAAKEGTIHAEVGFRRLAVAVAAAAITAPELE